MRNGELILYRTEDGLARVQLRAEDGTVWLNQAEIAESFDTSPQNITQQVRAFYTEGELDEAAICKDDLQIRREGARDLRAIEAQLAKMSNAAQRKAGGNG